MLWLIASTRFEDFPPIKGRHEGIERTVYAAVLNGTDLQGIVISGPGVIDGQGEPWWQADDATNKLRTQAKLLREAENPPEAPLKWPGSRVIGLLRCRDVSIEGL